MASKDYWCDGHFIGSADDATDAAKICREVMGHWPERVRLWTDDDQRMLDEITGD